MFVNAGISGRFRSQGGGVDKKNRGSGVLSSSNKTVAGKWYLQDYLVSGMLSCVKRLPIGALEALTNCGSKKVR